MKTEIIQIIQQLNPWLSNPKDAIIESEGYLTRQQTKQLLLAEWDKLCLVLVGPRQAGKTTLGLHLAQCLLKQGRFDQLFYLNCDFLELRGWLKNSLFIQQAFEEFGFSRPIVFIDEVQRLENPGLLLKSIIDLHLPIKLIASGSSQLELKSKVQEFLTGRQFSSLILPFSYAEIGAIETHTLIYGQYPGVFQAKEKKAILEQLYQDYISKDIVEILKVGKPDLLQRLVSLIAHSSGQLVNYQQLANDLNSTIPTIKSYLSILENTYVLCVIKPYVGNKRKEITSNPIYYFIDNGFRNQALRNFSQLEKRTDRGLLIEGAVFQEIYKYKTQQFLDFAIHFWRTQSGAEVDFVLSKNPEHLLPIEVKYQNMRKPTVPRALRSFIGAYKPKTAVIITKDFTATVLVDECKVQFIPFEYLSRLYPLIDKF